MAKEDTTNKIITIVLALVITIAAFTLIYINLVDDSSEDEDQDTSDNGDSGDTTPEDETEDDTEEEILLTMTYGDQIFEYTLSTLESFESYAGYGGIIKPGWFPDIVTEGPFNYTGIKISTLLDEFVDLPENYNITVTSSDQKSNDYNISQINGNVAIFNGTSIESFDTGGVNMILSYKKEGEYLDDDEGPLRIVFVDTGVFTSSKLWAKYVVSMELIETRECFLKACMNAWDNTLRKQNQTTL